MHRVMTDDNGHADMMSAGAWRGLAGLEPVAARRWVDAVAGFVEGSRVSAGLTATRAKHVRRFASWVRVDPWHVLAEHVEAWHESLRDLAPSTQTSMRGAVAAFYRWGVSAGRATADPTRGLTHRALRLPIPAAWEEPLTAFERFLWGQGTAPATVRAWGEQLRTIARAFPSVGPFEITTDDLFEWMAGQRWARETRRGRKTLLRVFYRWALDTDRATSDPTQRMPKVKAGDPVARPATDDEYAAALVAADERWTLALRLAAELGMRRGEVACVHTNDLRDDAAGVPWLTVHGKGAKVRRVPVPASLAGAVRAVEPGYLFPGAVVDKQTPKGSTGHLSARYVGKRIGELLPPGVTMHALRHRFATHAYNVDRDVFTVQRLLGHASPATTQRYVQVSDERMRALVEAVNGR